ncbi:MULTISPECIES: TIR domain-containing protein [unclassified Caballeronia]|uniref:TIR domain-containing protein n=1 Tax=unclassified Caballeronia TaxID=2646786 RepID=UPI0028554D23|nr:MULTISPECIES: TIR domain-containing protein [unclassified Caballeronia]MDR5771148.1 TIR domain-containing protein [Caballeronia sp. LZ002]MDR5846585.1 TIR domain-containing protein [Caballeronia sp. LZ003]
MPNAYHGRDDYSGVDMSYRNKTYVAFASEDIHYYRLMEAWRDNEHLEFNFYDAHDLYISRDTSKPETIKRNLRERLKNAKQIVLLGSSHAKKKGGDGMSFLAHEVEVIIELNLPVVVANLDGDRNIDTAFIPTPFLDKDYYTLSVSYQPKIIRYALDNYASGYAGRNNKGPHYYPDEHYKKNGI